MWFARSDPGTTSSCLSPRTRRARIVWSVRFEISSRIPEILSDELLIRVLPPNTPIARAESPMSPVSLRRRTTGYRRAGTVDALLASTSCMRLPKRSQPAPASDAAAATHRSSWPCRSVVPVTHSTTPRWRPYGGPSNERSPASEDRCSSTHAARPSSPCSSKSRSSRNASGTRPDSGIRPSSSAPLRSPHDNPKRPKHRVHENRGSSCITSMAVFRNTRHEADAAVDTDVGDLAAYPNHTPLRRRSRSAAPKITDERPQTTPQPPSPPQRKPEPAANTQQAPPETVPAPFSPTIPPHPALVAQGIEHRFPKPGVAGSNPAEGAPNKEAQ